jgi:predicted solute-binding protein
MLGVRKQEVSGVNIDDTRRLKQLRRRIRLTVQSVTSDVLTRMLKESEYPRPVFRTTEQPDVAFH